MVKVISFLIILSVLNLAFTVASTARCTGCNLNLFAPLAYPETPIRSVWPGDMVFGKQGLYEKSVITPSDHFSSTDIREQSFEPALFTNKSNKGFSAFESIRIEQFCDSNNWGLARFGKRAFIAVAPLSNARAINAPPAIKPFQNNQSDITIPSEYIFYEWAFFILVGGMIIEEIVRHVKKRKSEKTFTINSANSG